MAVEPSKFRAKQARSGTRRWGNQIRAKKVSNASGTNSPPEIHIRYTESQVLANVADSTAINSQSATCRVRDKEQHVEVVKWGC